MKIFLDPVDRTQALARVILHCLEPIEALRIINCSYPRDFDVRALQRSQRQRAAPPSADQAGHSMGMGKGIRLPSSSRPLLPAGAHLSKGENPFASTTSISGPP